MKKEIIEKYYLLKDVELVSYKIGTNGVDCWFENKTKRQHRCLCFEDFTSIKGEECLEY